MYSILSIQLLAVVLFALGQQARGAALEATAQVGSRRPLDGRIVGGWETSIAYFPHQVSLQVGTRHACGGAIIAPTLVLTAAHCVLEYSQPQLYSIRAGSNEWASGGSYVKVRRIIPHAQFNEPTPLNNDIAILELKEPLVYSRSIQPIALVTLADIVPFQTALFVSGWGTTSMSQMAVSPQLRYTSIVQLDHAQCKRNYVNAGSVTNTMMCAGTQFGGQDSCQGDSGGPLVTNVNGRLKLVGVVSWGIGCAQAQYPGIYTRVSAYGDWVERTMRALK